MNRYLRAWLISLTVATLLFGRQIADFSSPINRYLWIWSRIDGLIIAGSILLISLIGLALYATVQALDNPILSRLAGYAWIMVAAIGALSNISRMSELPAGGQLAWMAVLVAVFVVSWLNPSWRLIEWAGFGCLCLCFIPPIAIAKVLLWKPWSSPAESYVPAADKPGATPVYILSFDSLSGSAVMKDNEVRPDLPNLRQFSQQAYNFPNTTAPATTTEDALPRMVFQIDAPIKVRGVGKGPDTAGSDVAFLIRGKPQSAAKMPNLFTAARKAGYQTEMVTFDLPWRNILQQQCDYVHVYPDQPHGQGILGRIGCIWLRNLRYYPYPFSQQVWSLIDASIYNNNRMLINHGMQDEAFHIINTSPASNLGFFHFPVPRPPFIFNPDGTYHAPAKSTSTAALSADYARNVKYADQLIGKLIENLKESGKYDDALIIITSDHGWAPPRKGGAGKTTPPHNLLMIKIPHQDQPQLMPQRLKNIALRPIVQAAIDGKLTDSTMHDQIGRVGAPSTQSASRPATRPTAKPRSPASARPKSK